MLNAKIFSILDKNTLIILQIEWLSLHACSTSQPLSGGFRIILRGSIRNINYKKYKKKLEYIDIKKKHKILQLFFMIFHILKLLHDFFIINLTSYIYFTVHNQTIIHPLISHLIDLFRIC